VNLAVGGGAGRVASAAGLFARGPSAADSLLRLVSQLLTADDAKEAAGRRLHHARLVRHRLGGDIGGEGEGRESGDGLDKHCDGGLRASVGLSRAGSVGSSMEGDRRIAMLFTP